jgi:hypothetical protein
MRVRVLVSSKFIIIIYTKAALACQEKSVMIFAP